MLLWPRKGDWKACPACGGTGRIEGEVKLDAREGAKPDDYTVWGMLLQGICMACRGIGEVRRPR